MAVGAQMIIHVIHRDEEHIERSGSLSLLRRPCEHEGGCDHDSPPANNRKSTSVFGTPFRRAIFDKGFGLAKCRRGRNKEGHVVNSWRDGIGNSRIPIHVFRPVDRADAFCDWAVIMATA